MTDMADKKIDLKEYTSKYSFLIANESNFKPEDIQLSCLLRIAAATESMAKNHLALQADRDMYERWYKEEVVRRKKAENTSKTLKGHLTRKSKPATDLKKLLTTLSQRLDAVKTELGPISDFTGSRAHYLQGQKRLLEELLGFEATEQATE